MDKVGKREDSNKVLALNLIEAYPDVDSATFHMVWNGKRGVAFDDANQGFREQVILKVLKDPSTIPMALIYELMHEEARWAGKTLTFRYYLPELLELLMIHGLDAYNEKIVRTFTDHPYALKCVVDLKSEDEKVETWLNFFKRTGKFNKEESLNYEAFIDELVRLLSVRHRQREGAKAFESYVTHVDPWYIALLSNIKHLWKHGEVTWLALFFIVPLTLLMGYYFFGFAILYGMLPVFRALVVIYMIYRLAHWIAR